MSHSLSFSLFLLKTPPDVSSSTCLFLALTYCWLFKLKFAETQIQQAAPVFAVLSKDACTARSFFYQSIHSVPASYQTHTGVNCPV